MNISNTEDILDVREIIERVEELRDQRDNFDETKPVGPDSNLSDNEAQELETLESLLNNLKSCGGDHQWEGDWYPVTLIRRNYFVEYAKQYADDVGRVEDDVSWPYNHIDWEAAAKDLEQDYSTVDFDGQEYLYR